MNVLLCKPSLITTMIRRVTYVKLVHLGIIGDLNNERPSQIPPNITALWHRGREGVRGTANMANIMPAGNSKQVISTGVFVFDIPLASIMRAPL